MKIYWDEDKDDWLMMPEILDVLRDTYNICYEAYTECELMEVIKDILKKELLYKY